VGGGGGGGGGGSFSLKTGYPTVTLFVGALFVFHRRLLVFHHKYINRKLLLDTRGIQYLEGLCFITGLKTRHAVVTKNSCTWNILHS